MDIVTAREQFRQALVTDIEAKQEILRKISMELEEAETMLGLLDSGAKVPTIVTTGVSASPAPKARPGRAEVTNKPRTRGPRTRDGGPSLKDRIAKVLGNEVMNAGAITAQLTALGQMPPSDKPHSYVSLILSQNSQGEDSYFERVTGKGRGFYRNGPKGHAVCQEADSTTAIEDDTERTLEEAGVIPTQDAQA